MAKVERVLCPICMFISHYIDLTITTDGYYICPKCNASFSYEELMQIFSFSQFTYEIKRKTFNPFT